MRHIRLTEDDFMGFFPVARLCGQHGKGYNKSIDVVTDPVAKRVWYEFRNHHELIYRGPDLVEALDLYNNA